MLDFDCNSLPAVFEYGVPQVNIDAQVEYRFRVPTCARRKGSWLKAAIAARRTPALSNGLCR